MNVLVVGGTGWIGSRVLATLEAAGSDVIGLHHALPVDPKRPQGDLLDPVGLDKIVDAIRPDVVVHAGGGTHCDSQVESPYRAHVEGTANLIDSLDRHVAAAHLIIVGSAAEYGCHDDGPIAETHPCRPAGHYGLSKLLQTELAIRAAAWSKTRVTVLRLFNPVGPGMRPGLLLADLFLRLKHLRAHGGGVLEVARLDAVRDFVPIETAVEAIVRVARAGAPTGVFNVATGIGTSVGQVVEWLQEASDFSWAVKPATSSPHRSGGGQSIGDPSALERSLGKIDGPTAKEAIVAAYRRDVLETETVA